MGLGTNTKKESSDLIFVNAKHQDKDKKPIKPYFEAVKPDGNGNLVKSEETPDFLEGRLKRIDSKAREFTNPAGKKQMGPEKATLYIADDSTGETFALSLNYNIASRGLFNRILNLQDGKNLRIDYWRDAKDYTVLTLKQNGVSIKAKYSREEVPASPKVKVGAVEMTDTSKVDEFFKAKLLEFSATVLNNKKAEAKNEESEEIPF